MSSSAAQMSEQKLLMIALLTSILAFMVGGMVFYTHYAYAEDGHNLLAVGYIGFCILLFFGVRFWNMLVMLIAVVGAAGALFYASEKFAWRQNYIEMAQIGQPFALEEMIDHYPTYEEYTFAFLKAPDWVRFNNECVQPALRDQATSQRCASLATIERFYNINLFNEMRALHSRMRATAQKVANGKMKKRRELAQCIADKMCASIPLLPKGVDAEKLDPESKAFIGIRQAFWSLINDKKMSKEVCAYTPICLALVNMKAINPDKIPF